MIPCPCHNCILLPVCKSKVSSETIAMYDKRLISGEYEYLERYYYNLIMMIYRRLYYKCCHIKDYMGNDWLNYADVYNELKKIYYDRKDFSCEPPT